MSGSHLSLPRNETVISIIIMFCLPVPTFIYYERCIYFQDQSAYSDAGKYVDRSWEYIYKSLTDTWMCNCVVDWGHAIPRKGIHKCSVVIVVNSSYEKPWSIKRDFREMACFHQKEQNLELPPTSGSFRVKARDDTCFQEVIRSKLQIQNGQKCKPLF